MKKLFLMLTLLSCLAIGCSSEEKDTTPPAGSGAAVDAPADTPADDTTP